jgi:multiple sugar transport system ATP-binding protein
MVAGLEEISGGILRIGDRIVNNVAPKDRDIAMVFQSYALYPHMSVYDNMAFGLRMRKAMPKGVDETKLPEKGRGGGFLNNLFGSSSLRERAIRAAVESAAESLALAQYLDRKPRQLSGGQRQRVALGRAIVREPQVFLMDEPLSNLDAKLRVQTRAEISRLHRRLQTTTIYVTHDQTEAMTMGDRIAVLRDGILQQLDTPQNLYDHPANMFVAGFIGSPAMNFFPVTAEAGGEGVYLQGDGFRLRVPKQYEAAIGAQARSGGQIMMGLRPEDIADAALVNNPDPSNIVRVTVDVVELLGNEIFVYLNSRGGTLTARMDPDVHLERGQHIEVGVEPDKIYFFDPQSEQAIR